MPAGARLPSMEAMRTSLLAVLACGFVGWSALGDEGKDKADLAKFENDFAVILVKNDTAALEGKLAADWKLILSDGTVLTRDELVKAIKSGKLKVTTDSVMDLEVRVYGDAAVIIGISDSKGLWDGQTFTGRDRFTDVFIRKEGKWICVSSHSSDLDEGK